MSANQRLLTNSEMADFMLRHPLEAENILQTKALIATGAYDWSQWIPGTIPPWGAQIQDDKYGLVTVFLSQVDSEVYLSGNSMPAGDINKPAYVPPPVLCNDGSSPVLGICAGDVKHALDSAVLIAVGLGVFVGYQMLFAKK